jgi:hypothetical protein
MKPAQAVDLAADVRGWMPRHCRSLRDDVRDVLGLEVVDDELVPRKGQV